MKSQEAVVAEIDVKAAVQRAKEFAATLFEPERISRIGLEAVERTEDGESWLVTLGFIRSALYERIYSPLDTVLPRPGQ